MKLLDAVKVMRTGMPVQSQVTEKIYRIVDNTLITEGKEIPILKMPVEEAYGQWKPVHLPECGQR